jgi:hypothetical protein
LPTGCSEASDPTSVRTAAGEPARTRTVKTADSTAPFAWYGVQPVLFDAPSRWREGPVQWEGFLTIGPWDVDRSTIEGLLSDATSGLDPAG